MFVVRISNPLRLQLPRKYIAQAYLLAREFEDTGLLISRGQLTGVSRCFRCPY